MKILPYLDPMGHDLNLNNLHYMNVLAYSFDEFYQCSLEKKFFKCFPTCSNTNFEYFTITLCKTLNPPPLGIIM